MQHHPANVGSTAPPPPEQPPPTPIFMQHGPTMQYFQPQVPQPLANAAASGQPQVNMYAQQHMAPMQQFPTQQPKKRQGEGRGKDALSDYLRAASLVVTRMSYYKMAMAAFQSDATRRHRGAGGGKLRAWIHSERKLLFFFVLHFFATIIVWQHFAFSKFKIQEAKVPEGANLFWWKRLTPTLEFGAMHAILLQMSFLPLTMARHTISVLSETFVAKVIPFQRITAMHIHLGYTMITIVFFATVLFFTFFGQGCVQQKSGQEPSPNGVMTFCVQMTSEIMNTGYGIFATLLLVGATSYFRDRIPYEIFYVTHHLVFVMFAIAIAHTFDDKARGGQSRSQNFKWFTASLIWYLSDRAFMVYNTEILPVVEWLALGREDGQRGKVLILRLKRPAHWRFQPGQFASLNASSLLGNDYSWHPFSIGSSPSDPTLDFYIQVQAPGSWTDRLWLAAQSDPRRIGVASVSNPPTLKIQGPFGAALASWNDYGHVMAVSSGTGVVPMLSLLKSNYSRLVKVNATEDAESAAEIQEACGEYAFAVASRRLSILQYVLRAMHPSRAESATAALKQAQVSEMVYTKFQLNWRTRRLRESGKDSATYRAMLTIRSKFLDAQMTRISLLFLPVLEFVMATLAVSWSVLYVMQADVKTPKGIVTVAMQGSVITKGHEQVLLVLHSAAVAFFSCFWLTVVPVNTVLFYSDFVILAVSVLATVLWEDSKSWGHFSALQASALVGLALYRLARVWAYSALPDDLAGSAIRKASGRLDSFKFIFVARDAAFVHHLWAELDKCWSSLVDSWGPGYASTVSKIEVFCTDKDVAACERLVSAVKGTSLYKTGALQFRRPDFPLIMKDHLLGRVSRAQMSSGRYPASTSTIVAFTGSTNLGSLINQAVQEAVVSISMLEGNTSGKPRVSHAMDFVQENYGIATPAGRARPTGSGSAAEPAGGMQDTAKSSLVFSSAPPGVPLAPQQVHYPPQQVQYGQVLGAYPSHWH